MNPSSERSWSGSSSLVTVQSQEKPLGEGKQLSKTKYFRVGEGEVEEIHTGPSSFPVGERAKFKDFGRKQQGRDDQAYVPREQRRSDGSCW